MVTSKFYDSSWQYSKIRRRFEMGQADSLDKQEANDAERMRSGIAELMQLA